MHLSTASHGSSTLTLPAWDVKAISLQLILLLSAAFVLPSIAHALGLPVRMFLPMHWPVLLAGLCYGWRSGLIIGLSAPAVSYLISGMPPIFMLPAMTFELAAYGFVAGFARERFRLGFFTSLLVALISARALFVGYLFATGTISQPLIAYLQAAMLPGAIGAIGQLIALPLIARKWVGSRS